jgi:16S rRNA (cytidine1402-2'-O)-methyltransferase
MALVGDVSSTGAIGGSPTPEWYNTPWFEEHWLGVLAGRPGTLFVVATPIGNLEDITLRALRVLREADLVAAEDTRRTRKLLTRHTISTPTLSFHAHNARSRTPQLLARLAAGASVALVTDAGTPGVSDPGVELVAAAVDAGIAVDPVPGASAPLAALVGSGFPMHQVTLLGFPPIRSKELVNWLNEISVRSETLVFFEAPHRIRRTLSLAESLLGQRALTVARELTEVHQEFLRGTCAEVASRLGEPRGEFTIVVAPSQTRGSEAAERPDEATLVEEFYRLTKEGALKGRRATLAAVARRFGCSSKIVYAAVERAKPGPEPAER